MKKTDLDSKLEPVKEADYPLGLGTAVSAVINTYRDARLEREEIWKMCWAAYFGNPESNDYLRENVQHLIGDVNNDWRHRINTGKAFEIVETINAYLQGAFFPNSDWFDITPKEPGIMDLVPLMRKHMEHKLRKSMFKSKWEMYTRQALITGFSVVFMPWDKKTKKVTRRARKEGEKGNTYPPVSKEEYTHNNCRFEVLDSFDVFVDPLSTDPRETNVVRVLRKSKGDVMRAIDSGYYPYLDKLHVAKHKQSPSIESNKRLTMEWMGVEYDPSSQIELCEFWGDITVDGTEYQDVVVTTLGDHVAKFESNPFWCGKPFVIGTCIPIPNRPYGLGVLEPVLGQLHQLNVITNQRLDSLELAIDSVWLVVNDGVTDPEDVFVAPGKIIEVGDPNSIQPLQKDTTFNISYNEANLLESYIDKTVGTGAYIGTQQGRSGERVTATEIQAVRDAGGNRLSSIQGHVEDTQLLVLLSKMLHMMQQFTDKDELQRIPGEVPGSYEYVEVGPEELNREWDVLIQGATHVADKEFEMNKIISFVQLVAQFPQWAEMLNWEELLREVVRRFGFDSEVAQMVLAAPAPLEEMAPPEEGDLPIEAQALQDARAMGGKPRADMLEAQMQMQGPQAAALGMYAGVAGMPSQPAQELGQTLDDAAASV